MRLYLASRVSTQTIAPLHVVTLTVQRELPKYNIIFQVATTGPSLFLLIMLYLVKHVAS